jgi:hypothetical protein
MVVIMFFLSHRFVYQHLNFTTEQKFTAALTVLCIFADDPFSGLYIHKPSVYLIMVRVVIASLFRVFIRYYIVILYESLRSQRKTEAEHNNWMTFGLFFCLAIADAVASIAHEWDALTSNLMGKGRFAIGGQWASELLGDALIAFTAAGAIFALDSAEIFRFGVYTCHVMVFLLITTTVSQLRIKCVTNEINPVLLLADFFAHNYFVGMMNYVHWPCHDGKTYANPGSALNHVITEQIDEEYDDSTRSFD